jgi:chromosome condensin MukBEF complex kleisin-like MukF subunit
MNNKSIPPLKEAMLSAQMLGELYALMEVYSYEEFMQIYNQLPPKQQEKIKAICDRDSQIQLAAIHSQSVQQHPQCFACG